MKKTAKRVISLVLAMVMMVCVSVSAFAYNTKVTGVRYLSLGDSIAVGYGPYNHKIVGFTADGSPQLYDKAYPVLLNKKLNNSKTKNFKSLAYASIRTTELRFLIDPTYPGDEFNFFTVQQTNGYSEADFKPWRSTFVNEIKKADVITLEIGSNDVLLYTFQVMQAQMGNHYFLDLCRIAASQAGTIGQFYGILLDNFANFVGFEKAVAMLVPAMIQGMANLQTNFKEIVNKIYEYNPDVELLIVGTYNPYYQMGITDFDIIKLGAAIDLITENNNNFMRQVANSTDASFVDMMRVECVGASSLLDPYMLTNTLDVVHPTLEGHKDMANRIYNAHVAYVNAHK